MQPSPGNGLTATSRLMVDKIITVSRQHLGRRIGALQRSDLQRLNQSAIVFLGLAGS